MRRAPESLRHCITIHTLDRDLTSRLACLYCRCQDFVERLSEEEEDHGKSTAVGDQSELAGRGLILIGAFVSFVLSVSLWFTGHHDQGIFVGLWVPRSSRSAASPQGGSR